MGLNDGGLRILSGGGLSEDEVKALIGLKVVALTLAEYEALESPDSGTLYVISG